MATGLDWLAGCSEYILGCAHCFVWYSHPCRQWALSVRNLNIILISDGDNTAAADYNVWWQNDTWIKTQGEGVFDILRWCTGFKPCSLFPGLLTQPLDLYVPREKKEILFLLPMWCLVVGGIHCHKKSR